MTDSEYIEFLRGALDLQLALVQSLRQEAQMCGAQVDMLRKPIVDAIHSRDKAIRGVVGEALKARGIQGGAECAQLDGTIQCPPAPSPPDR